MTRDQFPLPKRLIGRLLMRLSARLALSGAAAFAPRLGWRLARCPVCESLFCDRPSGGCDGIPF